MSVRPKGGDLVLDGKSGCLYVSVHTRSKVFRPVPHEGNLDKFIRVDDAGLANLKIITSQNTPFIDASNAFDQLKSAIGAHKGKSLKVESVVVPDVSMERSASILLVAVNENPVKVLAASNDESLKSLFDKTAETINSISKTSNKIKKADAEIDVQPMPKVEPQITGLRM